MKNTLLACGVVVALISGAIWYATSGGDTQARDGDTISYRGMRIRLLGFDTPEIDGKCPAEIAKARAAKRALEGLIAGAEIIDVRFRGDMDRYGRRLAWLILDGEDVAHAMIASGLAREYHGGPRQGWCR